MEEDLTSFLRRPRFREKWNLRVVFGLAAYLSLIMAGVLSAPSRFWDDIGQRPMLAIGLTGL